MFASVREHDFFRLDWYIINCKWWQGHDKRMHYKVLAFAMCLFIWVYYGDNVIKRIRKISDNEWTMYIQIFTHVAKARVSTTLFIIFLWNKVQIWICVQILCTLYPFYIYNSSWYCAYKHVSSYFSSLTDWLMMTVKVARFDFDK